MIRLTSRSGEGAFEAALAGLEALIGEGIRTQVEVVLSRQNVHEALAFIELGEAVGAAEEPGPRNRTGAVRQTPFAFPRPDRLRNGCLATVTRRPFSYQSPDWETSGEDNLPKRRPGTNIGVCAW